MVSRVIKNELNKQMRDKIKEIRTPTNRPFDKIVIDYYNKILCSLEFWTKDIKEMIMEKFGPDALTEEEKQSNK
jgi:hypothetical protein